MQFSWDHTASNGVGDIKTWAWISWKQTLRREDKIKRGWWCAQRVPTPQGSPWAVWNPLIVPCSALIPILQVRELKLHLVVCTKIWIHFLSWYLLPVTFSVNSESLKLIFFYSLCFVWIQWKVSQLPFLEVAKETNFLCILSEILTAYRCKFECVFVIFIVLSSKLPTKSFRDPCCVCCHWDMLGSCSCKAQGSLVHVPSCHSKFFPFTTQGWFHPSLVYWE